MKFNTLSPELLARSQNTLGTWPDRVQPSGQATDCGECGMVLGADVGVCPHVCRPYLHAQVRAVSLTLQESPASCLLSLHPPLEFNILGESTEIQMGSCLLHEIRREL